MPIVFDLLLFARLIGMIIMILVIAFPAVYAYVFFVYRESLMQSGVAPIYVNTVIEATPKHQATILLSTNGSTDWLREFGQLYERGWVGADHHHRLLVSDHTTTKQVLKKIRRTNWFVMKL